MKQDSRIRVLVAGVQRELLESLVKALNLAGIDATGVGSGLHFYRALAESCYSIAVLDAGLADQNPYILADYCRKNTCMGIIMLSGRSTVEDRIQGYKSGADMFLANPVDSRELAAAILRLANRSAINGCAAAKQTPPGSWQLLKKNWQLVTPFGMPITLTAKEIQFLTCLAEIPGKPVRRAYIFDTLGYRDDEYANRAMDSLVRRLRRKIENSSNLPSPIKTIRNQGYCFSSAFFVD